LIYVQFFLSWLYGSRFGSIGRKKKKLPMDRKKKRLAKKTLRFLIEPQCLVHLAIEEKGGEETETETFCFRLCFCPAFLFAR